MQVIITVAGKGLRFQQQNYLEEKPMVQVMGSPAIRHLIFSFSHSWKLIFAVGVHLKNSRLEEEIKKYRPDAVVFYVPYSERGPVDTIMAALPLLDMDDSIAISYCDYAMVWNPNKFENFVTQSKCNCAVVSYKGFHPTYLGPNTYAHLKVDELTQAVTEIQEKKLFGHEIEKEWSSTGFYYFKTVNMLKRGLQLQVELNLKHGKEFYTSLAIKALMDQDKINVTNYSVSHFLQMGTPEGVQHIEKWYQYLIVENKKNTFEENSIEFKLYQYWKYALRSLLRA